MSRQVARGGGQAFWHLARQAPGDGPGLLQPRADRGKITRPATVEREPGDHEARFQLARALIGYGQLAEAVDQLLYIIGQDKDWNEGAARVLLLKVFDAAGPASDIAKTGRKRLSSVLFS